MTHRRHIYARDNEYIVVHRRRRPRAVFGSSPVVLLLGLGVLGFVVVTFWPIIVALLVAVAVYWLYKQGVFAAITRFVKQATAKDREGKP